MDVGRPTRKAAANTGVSDGVVCEWPADCSYV